MPQSSSTEQSFQPLAARLRPTTVTQFFGQPHLLGAGKPLASALEQGNLHSMILWGPPGTGKTTLARMLAGAADAHIIQLSAVLAGVKEIRAAVEIAKQVQQEQNRKTVLFIDEVHRFNKAQQDAFLPFVEDGTLTLIGATTENPSFELNSALLSRARVYVLKRLSEQDLEQIIDQAIAIEQQQPGRESLQMDSTQRQRLAMAADGDARRCLNFLEVAIELAAANKEDLTLDETILEEVLTDTTRRFDKYGEDFYNQISALHKAVRGSSPDASLYWFARMVDGGCDPLYIVRRVVRMASEDIGNADPRALQLALNAWETYERLGSPEGELAIAQAIVYMAVTAKSNAVYTALAAAKRDVKQYGSLEVPLHIRNAPTSLTKSLDYGKDYRYAHDEDNAYAAGENYFPDGMPQSQYYFPVERGLELKIKQKLEKLRELDRK